MSRRKLYAFCPVQHYQPAQWKGWDILSTETVTHPAGVSARVAEGKYDKAYPSRATSSGKAYEGYVLTRPAP